MESENIFKSYTIGPKWSSHQRDEALAIAKMIEARARLTNDISIRWDWLGREKENGGGGMPELEDLLTKIVQSYSQRGEDSPFYHSLDEVAASEVDWVYRIREVVNAIEILDWDGVIRKESE